MPVRIYTLAKDLKLDSKELVDLCNKIGITGKGSALASLEDEEVLRIKKHLESASATKTEERPAPSQAPAAPAVPVRGSGFAGKPQIIPQRRKAAPVNVEEPAPSEVAETAESVVGEVDELTPETVQVETPVAEEPVPSEPEVKVAAVDTGTDEKEAPESFRRDDYISPTGSSGGRIRVLGNRSKPSSEKPAEEKRRPKTREPVINLAKIPKTGQQPMPRRTDEPTPQRPDIKLTKDLIVGSKQGMKAPLDKFVQQETQKSKTPPPPGIGGLSDFRAGAGTGAGADKAGVKAKGKRTAEEEEEGKGKKGLAGLAAGRSDRTKRRLKIRGTDDLAFEEEREARRAGRGFGRRQTTGSTAPRKQRVALALPCNVRSFSEAAGVPAARILRSLMTLGIPVLNINAMLDAEQAVLVATDLGIDLEFKEAETLESSLLETADRIDDPRDLVPRAPIVTFLGHVDHGKTSLLDYLIGTKIVAGEAGGITQHIRAYRVEKDGRYVSFVDTPGHEAFTEMRARGANVTDIAVLVIAADDGIMPQTIEAISHAKAAEVPIVVALNKSDLPGADPNRVMSQMTEHGLTPSAWGGDVEVVQTSAITGMGMDELLETLLTVADLHELRANPKRAAQGVCLESEQHPMRGVIAKMVVLNGTLRVGDIVVCGAAHGRVKALYDTLRPNRQLTEAGPSVPVNITGLDVPPDAGERFHVLDDISQAREIAATRDSVNRSQSLSGTSPKVSFEAFQELVQSGKLGKEEQKVVLTLILRADTRGSLEAIEKELTKLDHPEVEVRMIQKSVGGVTVADVTLASASGAVIVGFNVIPDEAARQMAEARGVEIRRYDIIYNLANDLRAIIEGRLKPEQRVVELGRALVKQVFTISRVGTIAGCYVLQGSIERGCRIRVNRDGRTIGDYPLETLRRHKDDVKEVPRGMECGIRLSGFNDVKQDDMLEAYRIEEVARTLDTTRS